MPDGEALRVLTFEAGGQGLGHRHVRGGRGRERAAPDAGASKPPSLQGLANLRGKVVPVLSVEVLLGGGPAGTPNRVIVLSGENPVGLAVDGVRAMRGGWRGSTIATTRSPS